MSKVVIIGGGHAGANTAFALRKDGFDGDINIFCDESHLPYHRPPLSKDFLKQRIEEDKLSFKPAEFYNDQKISVHLNTRVNSIDIESNKVCSDDGSFDFDYLVFATGAAPRILPMENADAENLFYLRDISDVLSLQNTL